MGNVIFAVHFNYEYKRRIFYSIIRARQKYEGKEPFIQVGDTNETELPTY